MLDFQDTASFYLYNVMAKRVAIIGRANTGKSSLFNALIRRRVAIVQDRPGITRDIKEEWMEDKETGKGVWLLDSGGYVEHISSDIDKNVVEKIHFLIDNADVLLFVTDASTGITEDDEHLWKIIRKKALEKTILVVNKADNSQRELEASEFYRFNMEPVFFVSAAHRKGVHELREFLIRNYGNTFEKTEKEEVPKVAIVGRTNTGKSTLINAYVGEEVRIVSDTPSTTRDTGSIYYNKFGLQLDLLDTAGIRRRKLMNKNDLEFYAYLRTTRAIQNADVVVLLLDASEGLTHQDLKILHFIEKEKKPLIIAFNKWDLVKHTLNPHFLKQEVYRRLGEAVPYPILFISAKEKKNIRKVLQKTQTLLREKQKLIPAKQLNEEVLPVLKEKAPPPHQGKSVRIKFLQQVPAGIPTFLIFANYPEKVPRHYLRFIERTLREYYGFEGVPLRLVLKKS